MEQKSEDDLPYSCYGQGDTVKPHFSIIQDCISCEKNDVNCLNVEKNGSATKPTFSLIQRKASKEIPHQACGIHILGSVTDNKGWHG